MYLLTSSSQNRDIVVNFGSVSLGDAFSNPYNISAFLFLQLYVGIKDPKMELVVECQHIHFDLRKNAQGET